jgi:hypothetical protein
MNWNVAVKNAIDLALERNAKYLAVIDDVVGGNLKASVIEAKHGSHDLIISALAHVTRTVHGIGSGDVPPVSAGGWREPERQDGYYKVAPEFSTAWWVARNKMA